MSIATVYGAIKNFACATVIIIILFAAILFYKPRYNVTCHAGRIKVYFCLT